MPPLSRGRRDCGSPPSLCEDKTHMGAVPFSFWSFMGKSEVNKGDLDELERLCGRQKKEISVESGSFLLILDNLEGYESGCF